MSPKKSALEMLNPLLEDPEVIEIMIDGPERVTVQKHNNSIEDTNVRFGSNDELKTVIEEVLQMGGQKFAEDNTVTIDGGW